MEPQEIIGVLERLGITISLVSDNLKLSSSPPRGLEAIIKREKGFIIQYLRAQQQSKRFETVIESANRCLRGEISADEHFRQMDSVRGEHR